MSEFIQPDNLDIQLEETFCELGIVGEQKELALSMLKPLKEKGPVYRECYDHCIRVGILAKKIGAAMQLDEKALFYAGIFHDIGKIDIDPKLLSKTGIWTPKDKQRVQKHVLSGYKKLCGKFDFSAEIILHHHQYQLNPYPKKDFGFLHKYSKGTEVSILKYARILALADSYDAFHRKNSYQGNNEPLNDQQIEGFMIKNNKDIVGLVKHFYYLGIFVNSQKP
jgi:putative nucleotidyltransferase with HDIG domain